MIAAAGARAVRRHAAMLLALSALGGAAGAQTTGGEAGGASPSGGRVAPPPATPSDARPAAGRQPRRQVACAGQPITNVVVVTQPPYTAGLVRRIQRLADVVRELHATTRGDVVRRFLLLAPGDACDELRRAESERILRAQPYLVDARIAVYDDPEGGVQLEVETRDEFSAIVDLNPVAGMPPVNVLRVGEANLLGNAILAMGQWRDGGPGFRDAVGGRLIDYQLLGRPYQLMAQGERRRLGGFWDVDVSHPFFTDLQRVAWRMAAGSAQDHLRLRRPGAVEDRAIRYDRDHFDVAAILRVGVPGRLSLFGASVSSENVRVLDELVRYTPTGIRPDSGASVGFVPSERFRGQRTTRVSVLWGVRNVRFVPVTGFDALTGVQDVRRGFQLGTAVGRGVGFMGARDDDVFVSADAYVGAGGPRAFAALQADVEGRRDHDRKEWNGVVASGRLAWYLVPSERYRFVADVAYSGVWASRIPVQLPLGGREGGVRGYGRSTDVGARRLTARLEQRWVLGSPFRLGDLGVATFAESGRVWAGDAPLGITTPVRSAVGVGLLAAVPTRSRRLWRVDVAYPLDRSSGARLQVILSNRDLTRLFWRDPPDLLPTRERAVPSSIFNWPQR